MIAHRSYSFQRIGVGHEAEGSCPFGVRSTWIAARYLAWVDTTWPFRFWPNLAPTISRRSTLGVRKILTAFTWRRARHNDFNADPLLFNMLR